MRRMFALLLLFCFCPIVASAATPEKTLFGPARYDVKERYGKDNVYAERFTAPEGVALIRLQNGSRIPERSDFIQFKLNGVTLLQADKYDYSFLACVVHLQKENSVEIVLRDALPSGFRRPPLPPRFVIMTVLPYNGKLPFGVYGINTPEDLKDIAGMAGRITSAESASFALSSLDLTKSVETRAEAMRRLSDRKDASAQPFISALYNDVQASPEIRGEAALALGLLGDRSSIPSFLTGLLDAEEKIRLGSARALSFFSEEDTRQGLTQMLERLDTMRRDAVIRAIVSSGWKPVGTLLTLAESKDPHVSRTAIDLLGNTGDPRALPLLLKLLNEPGPRDVKAIITALGETRDDRATEALVGVARDPARRAGKEAELGEALAKLGDQKSADVIAEMIRKTESRQTRTRLEHAYAKLTGKAYK
jgi:HEAT repeat protein